MEVFCFKGKFLFIPFLFSLDIYFICFKCQWNEKKALSKRKMLFIIRWKKNCYVSFPLAQNMLSVLRKRTDISYGDKQIPISTVYEQWLCDEESTIHVRSGVDSNPKFNTHTIK